MHVYNFKDFKFYSLKSTYYYFYLSFFIIWAFYLLFIVKTNKKPVKNEMTKFQKYRSTFLKKQIYIKKILIFSF